MKMFPFRVCAFVLLALVAFNTAAPAAPGPSDPLTGDWLYFQNRPVTFNADGTARWKGKHPRNGTWEYLHNPEVQRHYRIVWEKGASIDILVLAEDGQTAHVRNEGDQRQYDVRRAISDPPAKGQYFGVPGH